MPELAEVRWFATRWNMGIGKTVKAVRADTGARVFRECDTKALVGTLPGLRLERIETAAKQAAFVFTGNVWLGVHLGMTGRLFTGRTRGEQPVWAREETGETAPKSPDGKHDLLTLVLSDGEELVFNDYRRFGKILFHTGTGEPGWWSPRPPEIVSKDYGIERLESALARHPKPAIKALLLDQAYFPGVGNWMADEILWRAGIAPRTPAGKLDPSFRAKLFVALKEVCADALRVIGSGWGAPPDSWLFNHRWKRGGLCPATGKPLKYETIGGRTACWSPAKQRTPADS